MKNKKLIYILSAIALILIVTILIVVFGKKEKDYTLTLSEKKWIDENKNRVIDISIENNIPIFTTQNGVLLSFLDYFEESTNLELNKTSNVDKISAYSFKIIDSSQELTKEDMLVYSDNYSIVSKNNDKISTLSALYGKKLGLLNESIKEVASYLKTDGSITYTTYENANTLFEGFKNEEVDFIVVPKNQYLDSIIANNYYIVYNLTALTNKYVLTINGNSKDLNSIFEKKYNEWYDTKYNDLYVESMNNYYFDLSNIDEKKESSFKSRVYIYGYVDNIPYETNVRGGFYGINSEFLKGFEEFSNVEFQFKKYNTVKALQTALNDGKVDIAFNYYNFDVLENIFSTIQVYPSNYVILSHMDNNVTIDSFSSLKGKEIYTIKDTALSNYINTFSAAKVNTYSKINNLLKGKEPLVLLDLNMYNYYKSSKLKDYYIAYEDTAKVNYNFIIKKDDINNIFAEVFQFYLTNINHKEIANKGMNNFINSKVFVDFYWVYYILIFMFASIMFFIVNKKRRIKKGIKEDKAKYIDHLTSLKNRNYLTHNMNKWDDNGVYPQAIVVINLNNLKDVNNNFGYEEGDRLIKTAANILINNQLENTDMIRTDGNEFLVYMVGYEQSQVSSYMKKIYKLMKELPYEHGATLGYSMIEDDMKLVEDAINEAVLDMVTNKEMRSME